MAQKTLGYVKLEWTCPNCGTKNPGPQRTCTSCGLPQPDNIQFEQATQEELIKDEATAAKVKVGPDVHCYYCGTRNPADAKSCSQCGADLTQATARASGRVVGALKTGPAPKITCPACGAPNEANAPKCVQCGASLVQPKPEPTPVAPPAARKMPLWLGIGAGVGVLLLLAVCIAFFVLSSRTSDLTGTVESVSWTRSVTIEELVPVTREDWRDEIPANAVMGTCTEEVRTTERRSTGETREVCGTPYTVDKGNGFAEVVQDCETEEVYEEVEVYDDLCEYTVEEWQQVDQLSVTDSSLSPEWPVANLSPDERAGERAESYQIVFETENGSYTYTTDDVAEFAQYQPGSRWLLKVNSFNAITSVEPVQGQ